MNEADLKKRSLQISKLRKTLTLAITTAEREKIDVALLSCLNLDSEFVGDAAAKLVGASGKASLSVLRKTLAMEATEKFHPSLLRALGKAGGEEVGPELSKMIETELLYWKNTAPELKRGWWNGEGLAVGGVARLQQRYALLLAALQALRDTRFGGCREAVTALRDYWKSLPQLQFTQLERECDAILKELK